jgi:4-amino-4-deoxy-L-arabinose transferase-like glycosyltransferase
VRRPSGADRIALLLYAAGSALRIGLTAVTRGHPERLLQSDSGGYLDLSTDPSAYLSAQGPMLGLSLNRPPGYPLFLHLLLEILGLDLHTAMLVQAAISGLLVLIVYGIGRRIATPRVALIAAGIVAFDPSLIAQAPFVLTEALFTVIVLFAVLLIVGLRAPARLPGIAVAGLLLGGAALIRPVAVVLGVVLGVALLLREGPPRARLVPAAVLVLSSLVVVGPWAAHNGERAGITNISSISAHQLLEYRAAGIGAFATETSTFRTRLLSGLDAEREAEVERLGRIVDERLPEGHTRADTYRVRQEVALEIIRAEPLAAVQVVAEGALWNLIRPALAGRAQWALFGLDRDDTGQPRLAWALAGAEALYLLALYASVLVGAWVLLRGRRFDVVALLALPAGYLLAAASGLESYSRFRGPFLPFLALLGAIGVQHLLARRAGDAREVAGPAQG